MKTTYDTGDSDMMTGFATPIALANTVKYSLWQRFCAFLIGWLAKFLPQAAVVHEVPNPTIKPTKTRRYPLGLGYQEIKPGETVHFVAHPQVFFKPNQIILPKEVAEKILVCDFQIGKNSQVASSDPLPGSCFMEDSSLRFGADTAQISQRVALYLKNVSKESVTFAPMVWGDAIE